MWTAKYRAHPGWTAIVRAALAVAVLIALMPRPVLADGAGETVRLAVIVGADTKVRDLNRQQLRRIFTSQPITSPDGKRYVPLNHPPRAPDRVGFDRTVLGMDPDQVGRYWIDRRIRGGAHPPRTVDNVATLTRLVERLPGAIAYLRTNQVEGPVRVVAVEGKQPDEPDYPIVYGR